MGPTSDICWRWRHSNTIDLVSIADVVVIAIVLAIIIVANIVVVDHHVDITFFIAVSVITMTGLDPSAGS